MGGGEITFANRERKSFSGRTVSPVNRHGVGVLGTRIVKVQSERGELVFVNGHNRLDDQAAGRDVVNLDRGVRHRTAAGVIGDGGSDRVRIVGCIGGIVVEVLVSGGEIAFADRESKSLRGRTISPVDAGGVLVSCA